MSNHGYTEDNLLSQLPKVLADDPRMKALATAIAKALMTHLNELPEEEIYTRIDELPEAVLDVLAYDFKIDWYNYDYPVEAKRNLFKTNYYVHRHLGTVGAVKEAICSIYPRSDVVEWFSYDGEPYYFIVALESGYPVIPVSNTDVLKAVYTYKSLRSHLEAIVYRTTVNVGIGLTTGYVLYWGRITGTYPERARLGEILTAMIQLGTHPEGVVYANPNTGEIEAGTFPARAVQGAIVPGEISASASGEGLAYSARLCGTAPGGIL